LPPASAGARVSERAQLLEELLAERAVPVAQLEKEAVGRADGLAPLGVQEVSAAAG
jgi:hypothetical protein